MKLDPYDAALFRHFTETHYVYLLLDKDEVVYVGKSRHVLYRVKAHAKSGMKFNSVLCHEVPAVDRQDADVQHYKRRYAHRLQISYFNKPLSWCVVFPS